MILDNNSSVSIMQQVLILLLLETLKF